MESYFLGHLSERNPSLGAPFIRSFLLAMHAAKPTDNLNEILNFHQFLFKSMEEVYTHHINQELFEFKTYFFLPRKS